MKKTLVAMAALAVVGAASAQSSVTLYGKLDATVQSATQKTAGVKTVAGNSGLGVDAAGLSGSRWGLKGTEDLGGGLKAVFQLESGFSQDSGNLGQGATGALQGLLFGRQAFVGVSGGFGTVSFGRQYSPNDNTMGVYDAQGYATNSAMGYAWNAGSANVPVTITSSAVTAANAPSAFNGFHADIGRINNSIYYVTPAMGGFKVEAMYAPGENKTPTGLTAKSAGSYLGGSAGYSNGPLGVTLAYESLRTKSGAIAASNRLNAVTGLVVPIVAAAAGESKSNDWILAAQYDFGAAKVYGGYHRSNVTGTNATVATLNAATLPGTTIANGTDTGWMLGTAIPFGAMTLQLGYARETTDAAAGALPDGSVRAFAGQLVYNLSKRTNLYTDVLFGRSTTAANVTTKNTIFGVGMRHDF